MLTRKWHTHTNKSTLHTFLHLHYVHRYIIAFHRFGDVVSRYFFIMPPLSNESGVCALIRACASMATKHLFVPPLLDFDWCGTR